MSVTTKKHKCDKCNRTFSSKEYLRKHNNRKNACNAVYKCEKCEKKFQNAALLERHNNRITSCVPESVLVITGNNEDNMCHMCGKTYASAYNLRRHQSTCTIKDNPNILINLLKTQQEQTNKLIDIINQNGLGDKITTINNNITNNVQQNLYMNVTFCSFGDEDFSKLNADKVMQLLRGQVKDFMSKMIEYIHTDPEHPELHNVYYDPERKKAIVFTRISDNEMSWQTKDFREVSDLMTDRIKDHVSPGNGPYFDMAMKERDYDTSNNIINVAKHINWKTDESVEMNQTSLSKLAKNKDFMNKVKVQEIE